MALTLDDEDNILGALQAKHRGVPRAMVAINRTDYQQLITGLGIDHVFSPRHVASRTIKQLAVRKAVQRIAELDEDGAGIYEINVSREAPAVGKSVLQLQLPPGCVLAAIERGDDVRVPGPGDVLEAGDTVVAIAHEQLVQQLNALFV